MDWPWRLFVVQPTAAHFTLCGARLWTANRTTRIQTNQVSNKLKGSRRFWKNKSVFFVMVENRETNLDSFQTDTDHFQRGSENRTCTWTGRFRRQHPKSTDVRHFSIQEKYKHTQDLVQRSLPADERSSLVYHERFGKRADSHSIQDNRRKRYFEIVSQHPLKIVRHRERCTREPHTRLDRRDIDFHREHRRPDHKNRLWQCNTVDYF